MALNIIDFSRGIRPEEIQSNFEYLQEQLSRERISVGGTGISSGLNITPRINDREFCIEVSAGSVIDEQGDEIFIEKTVLEVEPPMLNPNKEVLTLDKNKTVTLRHIPYALNRRKPSQYLESYEPEFSGIEIKYENSINKDDFIRVRDIQDKTITVTGALIDTIEVSYQYAAKRIEAVYIDKNFKVCVTEHGSISDTTPSAPSIPLDAKFLIAYIEVNNEYKDETDSLSHAYIIVRDDLKKIRNIYTDTNGDLFICGTPFDDLQIIHIKEPTDPKENSFWFNEADNTLYCWRPVNKFSYKNKIEIPPDFDLDMPDYIFSTYMDFRIGEGELSIYLNDNKLVLGTDYEEVQLNSPTYAGNSSDSTRGNTFRILKTLIRYDGLKDVLVPGKDVLTYIITYKDGEYMWVPINKMNYIPVKNTKVYSTYYDGIDNKYIYEIDGNGNRVAYFDSSIAKSLGVNKTTEYPNKYQYFLFHRTEDLNMHFTPNRNELSILINQMPLHEDQFKEITLLDLYTKQVPEEIISAAASKFGWTSQYIADQCNAEKSFDNSGIGFMLTEPLDCGKDAENIGYTQYNGSGDLFVEAIVERRICTTPLNQKLERSATFVFEDSIRVDENFDGIVVFPEAKYRYSEHQLEVFVNGMKQIEGVDYVEEFGYFKILSASENLYKIIPPINKEEYDYKDQDFFIRKKAAVCNKFAFLEEKMPAVGAMISIRITTNIYSYDHINDILNTISDDLLTAKDTIFDYKKTIDSLKEQIENRVKTVEDVIAKYALEDKKYLTTEDVLNIGQMAPQIVSNTVKSLKHINESITLIEEKTTYSLSDVWEEDYINVFHHNKENNIDSYLIRDTHYKITDVDNACYLILSNVSFHPGDILYISGIKLSNKREFK